MMVFLLLDGILTALSRVTQTSVLKVVAYYCYIQGVADLQQEV